VLKVTAYHVKGY